MFFEISLSIKKIITAQRAYKIIKQIITAHKAYKIIKKIWKDLPPFETAIGSIGLRSGYSTAIAGCSTAVAPTASSSGDMLHGPWANELTAGSSGGTYLPPDEPAAG